MKKSEKFQTLSIKRLPMYYHCLKGLEADGSLSFLNIISGLLTVTASQVRQDFSTRGIWATGLRLRCGIF